MYCLVGKSFMLMSVIIEMKNCCGVNMDQLIFDYDDAKS